MNRPDAAGAPTPTRPPIVLCRSDYDALEKIALAALLRSPRVAGALLGEVDRAAIVADSDLRPDVVRLGSWVEFIDSGPGVLRRVRLVESLDPEPSRGELSVLTTEGSALVGLHEGQAILWPDRLGADRILTVVKASNGPGDARPRPGPPTPRQAGPSRSIVHGRPRRRQF